MAATARKMVRCFCVNFEFGNYGQDGEAESFESYTTKCAQSTYKVFAMGHDAKLAGYLVRAELAGEEISVTQNGVKHIFSGAVDAARIVSDAFVAKVSAQLAAGIARAVKKQTAATRKAAKVTAPVPVVEAPKVVNAKVGRWVYSGTIDGETGSFTYRDRNGVLQATPKFTLV
jgi:hypothetical protein